MNTADLITAFFNNEMSPDQERQFLVSVASSDSLRLGLKSHVMLDKILYEESNNTRVSVDVRMNIMRQAAVVAATAGTALAADDALANPAEESSSQAYGPKENAGVRTPSRSFFRWSSAALVLVLGIGSFFAGFYTGSSDEPAVGSTIPEHNKTVSPAASSEFSTAPIAAPASSVSAATQESREMKDMPATTAAIDHAKRGANAVHTSAMREGGRNPQTVPDSRQPAGKGTAAKTASTDQGGQGNPASVVNPLEVINDNDSSDK